MIRKVRAFYEEETKHQLISSKKSNSEKSKKDNKSKPRHIGKRRRQQLLLGENYDPNNWNFERTVISSIKYDAIVKKRERKIKEEDNLASTSTCFTLDDKARRREYQGNKVYKRQKGGKADIDIFKKPLKVEKTGRWKYYNLYNEDDLYWFKGYSHQLIDNEVDDDWDTDDETMTSGIAYMGKKLLEELNSLVK